MSLPVHVSIVAHKVDLNIGDLTRVAAGISQQVHRDFGPIWNSHASVDAFARLEDVPLDSWPVIIVPVVKDAAGVHEDRHGQPFALVQIEEDWSLTASHETLEMLADPFGRRLRAGSTLAQAVTLGAPKGRVRYLLEICDPSEAAEFSYHAHGVLVSDFYTPSFFDPVKTSGKRYSFTGAIDSPLKVLNGGYISWHDLASGHWMQFRNFPDDIANQPHVVDLSNNRVFEQFRATTSLRAAVDRVTKVPKLTSTLKGTVLRGLKARQDTGRKAQGARAEAWHEMISALTSP